MSKKIMVIFLLLAIASGTVWLVRRKQESSGNIQGEVKNKNEVILYYGYTCPHCKVVEDWLKENPKIEKKAGLILKEVYKDQQNSRELGQRAEECQLGGGGVGVPFLYDKGECIIGDQPIIDYLKENYQ